MKYKIDATLKHGKVYHNFIGFYFLFLCSRLFFVSIFFVNGSEIYVLIAISSFFLLLSLFLFIRNLVILKEVKKWQVDAITLQAECVEKEDVSSIKSPRDFGKSIEILFFYENKPMIKKSGENKIRDRSIAFNKYVGKEITILYSPKYDEVMLLREKK